MSRSLKSFLAVHCALGLLACLLTPGVAAAAEAKLKALIVDGQNNHDWKIRRRC